MEAEIKLDGRRKDAGRRKTRDYHHGNLRQELIDVAVELIRELGPEGVAIREVARRTDVSPAAPFRHFASKPALMTAIAEEGITLLRELTMTEHKTCPSDHPIVRIMAFARGYIAWFVKYPVHYRVVADRPRIDFDESVVLLKGTDWMRTELSSLFREAGELGFFGNEDPEAIHFRMRALAYGLGRMFVDDHLREWEIPVESAPAHILSVIRQGFIAHTVKPKAVRKLLKEVRRKGVQDLPT